MQDERPPPNGRPVAEHPSLARYRDGQFRCGAATVAAEVVEQVAARIRLASIVADRELVSRYAELLDVAEQPLRNLLTDAAEITEAEVTRHLPADLTFLLSRLLKEIDKP